MSSIIAAPGRYIQGKGALGELCSHAGLFGKSLFILVDKSVKKIVTPKIEAGNGKKFKLHYEDFNGESSRDEVNRVVELIKKNKSDVLVGVGGGKALDTAKAAAYYSKKPVIIVPTIASTDAPCSALSVIYTNEGVFEEYLFLPSNPNVVLVDTDVIASAPAKFLVAGMGDALATYFEARATAESDSKNFFGGKITLAALTLAELCYETLLRDGYAAKVAVEAKVCTKAVENIIEANTYLSGIGFESGGLAACHAIHNGLTAIEETHSEYHGEKVAFGTLAQLVLENDTESFDEVMEFCKQVGLPVTFEGIGIKKVNSKKLMEAAKLACAQGDTMGNMPFEVTPEMVYDAMIAVDAMGRL